MSAAPMILYIDVSSNNLLVGLGANQLLQPASLPFYYGDTLPVQVFLLQRLTTPNPAPSASQYSIVSTAGLSLSLYLTDGLVGGTTYTNQLVWATDANNQYFYANLPMNTAGIQALVTAAGLNPAKAYLQVGYTDTGSPISVLNKQIQIKVGIPPAGIVIPPGFNALSVEVANASYFPLQPVAGLSLQLKSPNGKIFVLQIVDQPDGSALFAASPIN